MLANGVRETTATTGTGTVTLAAVTGFVRFSQAFGVNAQVSYAIKDGNNWEWGIGTVGATNTLARTLVHSKYEGGAYSEWPAPLTLSGNAEVYLTEIANRQAARYPTSLSRGVIFSDHHVRTTSWHSTTQFGANAYLYFPFVVPAGGHWMVTGAGLDVTTTGTATKARIGLVRRGATQSLDRLLGQTGDLAMGTTGYKTSSFNTGTTLLVPGEVYNVVLLMDGTATVRTHDAMSFNHATHAGSFPSGHHAHAIASGWTAILESEITATFRNGFDWEKHPIISLLLLTPP